MRTRVRKAFTLVEILIVVVILGILAAIVVPQFTNATQDAQGGNIQTQLDTLNNQIELYRARNNAYPNNGSLVGYDWLTMIQGGYLKSAPKNPYNGSTTVAAQGASAPATDGWTWGQDANGIWFLGATNFDEATGKITPGIE
jgi:general secretion pathway protein G